MDTTALTNPAKELTALDRCDSCGAQAYVQVFLEGGDLLFCGHHYKSNEEKLIVLSTYIHDETHRLIPSKPEPEDVE